MNDRPAPDWARLNLRVGVGELLHHTGRFELVEADPPVRHVYPSNGLGSLPVRLAVVTGAVKE